MRIVAGEWRGRALVAPVGLGTRPTADRLRQALFDMLMHAEWGGRAVIEGAVVLDVFAGTGALGLEALSRGAASACFIENDAAALRALRANVAACKAGDRAIVLAMDAISVPGIGRFAEAMPMGEAPWHHYRHGSACPGQLSRPGAGGGGQDKPTHDDKGNFRAAGVPAALVFLDPPYGQNLVPRAIARLLEVGRIRPDALVVAETGRGENWLPEQPLLAERQQGSARILIFRAGDPADDGISQLGPAC